MVNNALKMWYFYIIFIILISFNYDTIYIKIMDNYRYLWYRRVNLLFENNIFIKGEITQSSINTTISEINKSEKQINLIIDSNGGNLISGYNLIREMLKKTNINCYAINAQSTAFTIFQYCNNRYVMPDSTLFQHNISISFKGSFEEFDDFYKTRFDSYRLINHMVSKTISKKIKLKKEDYLKKIWNDWTIEGGEKIIENNLADEIVIINNLKYLYK